MPQDIDPNSLPLQGGKGFSRSSSKFSSLEGVWLPRKREKMRENEAGEKEAGELKASPKKKFINQGETLQCLA